MTMLDFTYLWILWYLYYSSRNNVSEYRILISALGLGNYISVKVKVAAHSPTFFSSCEKRQSNITFHLWPWPVIHPKLLSVNHQALALTHLPANTLHIILNGPIHFFFLDNFTPSGLDRFLWCACLHHDQKSLKSVFYVMRPCDPKGCAFGPDAKLQQPVLCVCLLWAYQTARSLQWSDVAWVYC